MKPCLASIVSFRMVLSVKSSGDRQKRFDAAMAEIARLPAEQQVDALLQFFSTVLNEMSPDAIRRRRDELMARFTGCGCSYETCSALVEMVDHHVSVREKWFARQAAAARRTGRSVSSNQPGTTLSATRR